MYCMLRRSKALMSRSAGAFSSAFAASAAPEAPEAPSFGRAGCCLAPCVAPCTPSAFTSFTSQLTWGKGGGV